MVGRSKVNEKPTISKPIEEDLVKYVEANSQGESFSKKLRHILVNYASKTNDSQEELESEKEWHEETRQELDDVEERLKFARNNPQFRFPYKPILPFGSFGSSFCINLSAALASGKGDIAFDYTFRNSKGEKVAFPLHEIAFRSMLGTGKLKCGECGLSASRWTYSDKSRIPLCRRCYDKRGEP